MSQTFEPFIVDEPVCINHPNITDVERIEVGNKTIYMCKECADKFYNLEDGR